MSKKEPEKSECKYCKELFKGVKRHEIFCPKNPDYKEFEECEYCKKQYHPAGLPQHRVYCKENPNRKEKGSYLVNRLKKFQKQFPEFYDILSKEQIEEYLGINSTNKEVKEK